MNVWNHPASTVAHVKTKTGLSPVDADPVLMVPFVENASRDGQGPSVRRTSMSAWTALAWMAESPSVQTLKVALLVKVGDLERVAGAR